MTAPRFGLAWLAVGALVLGACSPGHATAVGRARRNPTPSAPDTSATPVSTTTTVPPTTVASTTTTPTIAVAPATALTAAQWTPVGLIVNGVPTLTATLLSARPGGPLTGVVRINATVTRPVLYAGTAEPGGSWPNQGAVAAGQRAALVAAFNGGFHTYASDGGWYDQGRTAVALRVGAASLVIRAGGSATVGSWGRDASLTPDVVSVRQNLSLLVDGGVSLAGTRSWGVTLGHVLFTWRSGVGVDASGYLIYAGGPGLDAQLLAQVLIQAGAVRAMELDINPQWVSFSYYRSPDVGADLLAGMSYGPSHWLSGSARDFFAVFTR